MSTTITFQVKPLRENERGVEHREAFLRNISSMTMPLDCWIYGNTTSIKLYIQCQSTYAQMLENMFYASFPESELLRTTTFTANPSAFLSWKPTTQFADTTVFQKGGQYIDPMKDILAIYTTIDVSSTLGIQFSIIPKKEETIVTKITHTLGKIIFPGLYTVEKKTLPDGTVVVSPPRMYIRIGYMIQSGSPVFKQAISDNVLHIMQSFIIEGKLVRSKSMTKHVPLARSQIVHFFHLPTVDVYVKELDYGVYRKLPYPYPLPTPANSPKSEFTLIGTTDYRNDAIDFGMLEEDKFRHVYVVGKTGTGKSTFLSNLIVNDIKNGKGVGLLDPHGELVDTVLDHIPAYRTNDVILFDVSDSDFPIGFNLLQYKHPDEKTRIVSGIVTTFNKLFAHSRGPRLEYILRNVLLTLIEYPNATLMHILRVLTDKTFREEVVSHTKDTMIMKFWTDEFNKRDEKQRQEAIGPITNKIGQFLSSSVVRNIFGQPKSKLSLREAMDSNKIILINLSKGKIGEDNANMIGSLLVTKFQIDAMSRADMHHTERVPFFLYIDEFQNFATDSFAVILSEARKYKLSLIMANQYTSQLLETIRDAIFGNIGSIFSFTIGYDDAKVIAAQFKELVTPNDLISLPRFTAYTRMMIDGVTSDPFSLKTKPLPTPEGSHIQTQKIIEQSRQRYAMERVALENLLDAWNKKNFSPQEKIAEKGKREGMGISGDIYDMIHDSFIQSRLPLFQRYAIGSIEPVYILFDVEQGDHKAIWYSKPEGISDEIYLDNKRLKGQNYTKNGEVVYEVKIHMYEHSTIKSEDDDRLDLWIGTEEEIQAQLLSGFQKKTKRKLCPNPSQIEQKIYGTNSKTTSASNTKTTQTKQSDPVMPKPTIHVQSPQPQSVGGGVFSLEDITIGDTYSGYVKLLFNYGIFVTVKGVEGLLHKNEMIVPEGVSWKKFFNLGDSIQIKAKEKKEINGKLSVVWTML